MYGDHVANLNVYVRDGPNLGQAVYTRSQTQNRVWQQASVDVSSNHPFQV
jgi:hypothetical protein